MNLTWLGFRNLLPNPFNLTGLCTCKASWDLLRNLLRNQPPRPSPEWLGPAPKPPRPPRPSPESSPEPSPEPCWTWHGSCTKASGTFSETFSGTFSGALLNLTWLCTKASQTFSEPSEPSPEPSWTWPGACTSARRSYSGLKTPLAYAVGEKYENTWKYDLFHDFKGSTKCENIQYKLCRNNNNNNNNKKNKKKKKDKDKKQEEEEEEEEQAQECDKKMW